MGCCFYETIPCKAPSTIERVEFEDFREFGDSKYKISISKCQQLALSVANGRVPLPSQQLELANQKREKVPRSSHVLTKFSFSTCVWFDLSPFNHEHRSCLRKQFCCQPKESSNQIRVDEQLQL